MEMEEDILKGLTALQAIYKTNFEMVSTEVRKLAEQLREVQEDLRAAQQEQLQLNSLQKEMIAEKDVQIQRLIKATAALTVIADQISEEEE